MPNSAAVSVIIIPLSNSLETFASQLTDGKVDVNSGIAVAFSLVPILIAIMYYKKIKPKLMPQNSSSSDFESNYQ